jgi:hypothetical protein
MFTLDPDRLSLLRSVAVDFFVIFVALALISAVLLQGFHELLRPHVNRYVVRGWLQERPLNLEVEQFCAEMGAIGVSPLSLPYWQLTGQIAAALSSELEFYPSSMLVNVLADGNKDYRGKLNEQLRERGVPEDKREAAIFRDVAGRAQAGINFLHVRLRTMWNIFDYGMAFLITSLLGGLLTTLQQTQGQRPLLYATIFFSWLATPILRRMIENFVPFR